MKRIGYGAGVVGVALAVVPFELIATNDGPRHLLGAAVHHDPAAFPCYAPISPVTSAFMSELFGPFLTFFSASTAAAIVGRILPVLVACAAVWCARRLGATRAGSILAALAALNQGLALGFVPYELGLAAAFLSVGVVVQARSVLSWGCAALLLVFTARCHVVAAIGGGLVCAAVMVDRFGFARGLGGAIALGVAPFSVVVGMASESTVVPRFGEPGSPLEQIANAGSFLLPLPTGVGVVVGLLLAAALGHALRRDRRAAFVLALAFAAASVLLPRDVAGWQYGGLRLLPFVVVVAAATLPETLASLCVTGTFAAACGFAVGAGQAAAAVRPFIDDVERLSSAPRVELEAMVGPLPRGFFGNNEPVFSIGQIISLKFGNMPLIGQHTSPGFHSILEECSPSDVPLTSALRPVFVDSVEDQPLADIKTWASHADGVVLVVSRPSLVPAVANAIAFEAQQTLDHLVVGVQRRCPVDVVVSDARPGLDVYVGFLHATEPARVFQTTEAGTLTMRLDLPCGARQLVVDGGSGRCVEGKRIAEVDSKLVCTWRVN
jgi:hypothetical protein